MTVFSDLLLECGPVRIANVPFRGSPWSTAWESQLCRLRISKPLRDVPILTGTGDPNFQLWAIGEIDEYDGRTNSTETCLLEFQRDLAAGCAKPERLSGRFFLLAWSLPERKWSAWTDRTGGVHAYLVPVPDGLVLGTFTGAVYPYSRRQLDWQGLSSFFTLGFFQSDSTFYLDCRVLRPATCYQFSESGVLRSVEPYWRWTHSPSSERSEDDTIAEFGHTLSAAVARQAARGKVTLPLSGGLDSRTVAACLPAGSGLSTYGYGYREDSVEIALSRQVAEAAGLPFHGQAIQPYLFQKLPNVLDAVEGFQDLTQTRQAGIDDWLGARADFVLGAHWGDVLCDSMGIDAGADPQTAGAKIYSKMVKRGSSWLVEHLCAPNLDGTAVEPLVQSVLLDEFGQLGYLEDADFRAKALKTTQWAFRWTLPSLRAYQLAAVPRVPFLSSNVLDFFCSVPTGMLRGRRLQIEYLKRFAPALARVRWQAYDADLFHYQHFSTWQLPRRAWNRALRSISTQPRIRRNWEVQFRSPGMPERLRSSILDKDSIALQFVPAKTLSALLDEFDRQPAAANGYTVSMLFTFCAWARRFHSGAL